MEFLIAQGVPMRSAHEAVGKLVRLCEERRCRLADLPAEAFERCARGWRRTCIRVLGRRQRAGRVPQRRLDRAGGGRGGNWPAWRPRIDCDSGRAPRSSIRPVHSAQNSAVSAAEAGGSTAHRPAICGELNLPGNCRPRPARQGWRNPTRGDALVTVHLDIVSSSQR